MKETFKQTLGFVLVLGWGAILVFSMTQRWLQPLTASSFGSFLIGFGWAALFVSAVMEPGQIRRRVRLWSFFLNGLWLLIIVSNWIK